MNSCEIIYLPTSNYRGTLSEVIALADGLVQPTGKNLKQFALWARRSARGVRILYPKLLN